MPYIYKIDENFFLSLNPESAYVLGWIYSDGTLRKNRYQFKISSNDKESIQLIKQLMKSDHKIYEYLRKGRKFVNYALVVDSKKLYVQLAGWGLTPNKSGNMRLPELTTNVPHFLRGYFEGDGSVWVEKIKYKTKTYRRLRVSFTSGSEAFLEDVRGLLQNTLNFKSHKIRKNHSAFSLEYSTVESSRLLSFIYNDNLNMAMRRKLNVFQTFLVTVPAKGNKEINAQI